MNNKTPPMHAKGVYQLLAPWSVTAGVIYECIAIRTFNDFVSKGEDVYERVYLPLGLAQSVCEADRAAGVKIVTLYSDSQPLVVVPDSYIAAYPSLNTVAYNAVVISLSLGAIPDGLDLSFLKNQLSETVLGVLGATPDIHEHVLPSSGAITAEQHAVLETARQAAITHRTTDRARVLEQQGLIDRQRVVIDGLEQILRDRGELPA